MTIAPIRLKRYNALARAINRATHSADPRKDRRCANITITLSRSEGHFLTTKAVRNIRKHSFDLNN